MPDQEGTSPHAYTFTVFTPTYNRADTLPRVYESLKAQTFADFEWLVVDDGSTDQTRALVEGWQREAGFPIRYFHQENRGKHAAFNRAVREAKGELLLNLDSDDRCVPNALERLKCHWDSIPGQQRPAFSAVTANCVDQEGKLVGTPFPKDVLDSDPLEMRYRYRVRGEKWGFQRTDVLRQYPFPEALTRQYVPEDVVWTEIARKYKTRFVNEALRIYHSDQPSMVHGQEPGKNAEGGRLQHLTVLNRQIGYFRYAPLEFCRSAVHYARFSFHARRGVGRQWADLGPWLARLLWAVFLPVGWAVYFRDKR